MTAKEREAMLVAYGLICRQRAQLKSRRKDDITEAYARWEGAQKVMLASGRFTKAELRAIYDGCPA